MIRLLFLFSGKENESHIFSPVIKLDSQFFSGNNEMMTKIVDYVSYDLKRDGIKEFTYQFPGSESEPEGERAKEQHKRQSQGALETSLGIHTTNPLKPGIEKALHGETPSVDTVGDILDPLSLLSQLCGTQL